MSMYKYIVSTFLLFLSLSSPLYGSDNNIKELLELKKGIQQKSYYTNIKENSILEVKQMRNTPNLTFEQQYDINLNLYNQYNTFISDSAIVYAKKNIALATHAKDYLRVDQSKLLLSSSYIVAGMYLDAMKELSEVNPSNIPIWLRKQYYDFYKQLYKSYSVNNINASVYIEQSALYRDSLVMMLDVESNHYKIVISDKLLEQKEYGAAEKILLELFNASDEQTHERAILAYSLAIVYGGLGNKEKEERFYAISALLDIKNAIKENAALSALASIMYSEGDIYSAYLFIKSSMEDAMFSNAKLRSYEVSKIFPIIDSAYQKSILAQKSKLKYLLLGVSITSFLLLLAIIYVYKQMKRVSRIQKALHETTIQQNILNTELNDSNKKLNQLNSELKEANKIKETYLGQFLDLCSTYINKLEAYQNTLNKKARDKKLEELYKMLQSRKMIEDELAELLNRFDNIFLQLYPDFVEEFNSLLKVEERFELNTNELLSTELRIFALIRLGINESSRIANFLHYSPNTIYNYRTRTRNRALVPRDEFEDRVMEIGSFTK